MLGNTVHDSVTFTIDAYLPTINIDSPSAMSYSTHTITVTLSGTNAEYYWFNIVTEDDDNQT